MSTEPEFNAEQIREMKNRVRDARIKTLAHLETAYETLNEQHENLRKTTMLIAELNETLREIDAIESDAREKAAVDVASAGHRIDPKARKALVKVDGTATDFAFSVIGLTDGGASTTDLWRALQASMGRPDHSLRSHNAGR